MIVLGLDTSLPACSVAVVHGDQVLARLSEPMTRGHQERLAPMVREAMAQAGADFADLARIGVTVGPGSFTGLRVGLSFAKAMALALDIPCIGAGSLAALAASVDAGPRTAAVIDARRGQVYLQLFEEGASLGDPAAFELPDAVALVEGVGRIVGPGAALLQPFAPAAELIDLAAADPVAVARLAASARDLFPARPIYLRPPDARPQFAPA